MRGEVPGLIPIPSQQSLFLECVHQLFPRQDSAGLLLRRLLPPDSPATTVVWLRDLTQSRDLERLVLVPLSQGSVTGTPEALAETGRFPAARLRSAPDGQSLVDGLLEGMAAIHVDGFPGALLVGSGLPETQPHKFSGDLEENVAVLHRQIRRVDLLTEYHTRADGSRIAVVFLKSRAPSDTVQAVRDWSINLSRTVTQTSQWLSMWTVLRVPPAMTVPSPVAVADALTRGYVAVLRDDREQPYVAPTTLQLLFSTPGDVTRAPSFRRIVAWPRAAGALAGLLLSAALVAATAYHHTLIPGPFLVALGASRINLPFPVVGEILLVSLLSDAFHAAAIQVGERWLALVAILATLLALMAMMQVGVLGGVTGVVGIVDAAVRAALPNATLRGLISRWRYLFIGAAAGLGIFGMAILFFLVMAYLAEERPLDHPLRLPPSGVPQ